MKVSIKEMISNFESKQETERRIFASNFRDSILLPYCKDTNYSFFSGGSDWFFSSEEGDYIGNPYDDKLRQDIYELLISDLGRYTLGDYIKDIIKGKDY